MTAVIVWMVIIVAVVVAYRLDVLSNTRVLVGAVAATLRLYLKFIPALWRMLFARR